MSEDIHFTDDARVNRLYVFKLAFPGYYNWMNVMVSSACHRNCILMYEAYNMGFGSSKVREGKVTNLSH